MNLRTAIYYVKGKVYNLLYKMPKIMTDNETIEYIKRNKCSISRFGDGELTLMLGFDIPFQRKNEILRRKLKEVKTTTKCLACIPNIFKGKEYKNFVEKSEFEYWNKNKKMFEGMWKKYFYKNKILGDSFISRFYIRLKDKTQVGSYIENVKKLWQGRDVVFIEGENSRLGYGNDFFENTNSIRRILCPSTNAFTKYKEIMATIRKYVRKEDLIILALGPTATVMAYELSELGYQALDLGHIDIEYEWYKMGAKEKCSIPNKHVNECGSLGTSNKEELNKQYFKEIICKI